MESTRASEVARAPVAWLGPVAAGLLVSAAAGALVFSLWPVVGLPARGEPLDAPFLGSWRWFFAVWWPALFPAFTLVHERLVRRARALGRPDGVADRARRWDRWSYGLLPVFLVTMVAWQAVGGWRWTLATFYVVVLAGKVVAALVVEMRMRAAPPHPDRVPGDGASGSLVWLPFALYVFALAYVITALSTAGDEHVYLLNTHSLYADRDLDLRNNIAARDYARFYWGRPSPGAWNVPFVGFPALLLPGYAAAARLLPAYPLAGRLGATLTVAACAALLTLHVYRLCRDLGVPAPAARWAWLVVAFTPPVLVNSAHVYPELPAALVAVIGVRAVLRLPSSTWRALPIVLGAAVVLVGLKDRYAPLAVWLLGWAALRLARGRLAVGGAVLVAAIGAAVYVLAVDPLPWLFRNLGGATQFRDVLLGWNRLMPQAALGLLADQEFGLLYYGPHWLLAPPGFALMWRRRRGPALGLAGLAAFYLLVLVKYRWMQWDAGWTPPPRFALVAAPLLAPFIAEVFDRGRGTVLAAVDTVCLIWSATVGFWLVLVPFWRYNDLDGRSTLLQVAGTALGLDLARFLPSLRAPTAWTWTVVAVGGAAVAGGCWYWTARNRRDARPLEHGALLLAPGAALGLTAGLAALWLALAASVPTWAVEAVAMRHSAGIAFGSYQYQNTVWVMNRPGALSDRIVTWPGTTEIRIVAAAYTTTGTSPQMRLLLDDAEVQVWRLAAGDGQWLPRLYTARVATRFGRPTLRLEVTDVLDRRDVRQVQHAYVGRIWLTRVADRALARP